MKKFIYVKLPVVDSLDIYYKINKNSKEVEEMLIFTNRYYCYYDGHNELLPSNEDTIIPISRKKYYQKLRRTILFKL